MTTLTLTASRLTTGMAPWLIDGTDHNHGHQHPSVITRRESDGDGWVWVTVGPADRSAVYANYRLTPFELVTVVGPHP